MQIWDQKQFQEQIKNELWSHAKAVEEEKAYNTETLKQPKKPKRDTFAEMEEKQRDIPLHRDSRRFIMIEDEDEDQKSATLTSKERFESDERPSGEEYEMKMRPPEYTDEAGEEEPLVSENRRKGKEKKKGRKESRDTDDEYDADIVGKTTPLYSNPVFVKKRNKSEDEIELQDGTQADSWV